MKVKLNELVQSEKVIYSLFNQKLQGSLAFKIRSIVKTLEPHLKNYQEVRIELLNEYAVLNEEAGIYTFDDAEKSKKFANLFKELLDTELNLEMQYLSISDLDNIGEITPQEIDLISWFITNEDGTKILL